MHDEKETSQSSRTYRRPDSSTGMRDDRLHKPSSSRQSKLQCVRRTGRRGTVASGCEAQAVDGTARDYQGVHMTQLTPHDVWKLASPIEHSPQRDEFREAITRLERLAD